MEHDVIEHTALATEAHATLTPDTTVGIVEELLVEEISIDGMCGVY